LGLGGGVGLGVGVGSGVGVLRGGTTPVVLHAPAPAVLRLPPAIIQNH